MVCILENCDNYARPLTNNIILNTHDIRTETETINNVITTKINLFLEYFTPRHMFSLLIGTRRWKNCPGVKKNIGGHSPANLSVQ